MLYFPFNNRNLFSSLLLLKINQQDVRQDRIRKMYNEEAVLQNNKGTKRNGWIVSEKHGS
jgi:hypothetical protein